jgi:hypothetical protein
VGKTKGADLRGANLRKDDIDIDVNDARNLTCEQLASAIVDDSTKFPVSLKVKRNKDGSFSCNGTGKTIKLEHFIVPPFIAPPFIAPPCFDSIESEVIKALEKAME